MRTYFGSAAIFCVMTVMFLIELAGGAVGNDARLLGLGALPDSGQIHHEYWRLLTAGFLHYDLTHFALNTLLLLLVGPVVERRAGTAWLLLIFLSGSVASCIGMLVKHLLLAFARRLARRVGRTIRPSGDRARAGLSASLTKSLGSNPSHRRALRGTSLLSVTRRYHDRAHRRLGCRHHNGTLDPSACCTAGGDRCRSAKFQMKRSQLLDYLARSNHRDKAAASCSCRPRWA